MARPVKHNVDYFPHDAKASGGKTLTILEDRYKNNGYAFWFKLLETLADSPDHYYDCNNPLNWEFLQAKTHLDEQTATQILDLLVSLEAIDKALWQEKKVIWCDNLIQRLAGVYVNRRVSLPPKPSCNGQEPSVAVVSIPDNTPSDDVSTADKPQSKVKKSKVKESKEYNTEKLKFGEFKNVLLTELEMSKLVDRFGDAEALAKVEQLSQGIASKGYKYKDHYATVLAWDRMEKKRQVDGTHQGSSQKTGQSEGSIRQDGSGSKDYTTGKYGHLVQH